MEEMVHNAPRILLVDDDEVFLNTMCRSLRRRGALVDEALKGERCEAFIISQVFDLVILDLNLAGESGLQLLQRVLALRPAQRVVMLTAYSSIATAVEAIKMGADNYLCKPVTATDIFALFESSADGAEVETQPIPETPLSVERLEWEHVQRVLRECDGNISAAARALNMHRRTLQRKLQKRPVAK